MSLQKKSSFELRQIAWNLGIYHLDMAGRHSLIQAIQEVRRNLAVDSLGHAAGSTNWGKRSW